MWTRISTATAQDLLGVGTPQETLLPAPLLDANTNPNTGTRYRYWLVSESDGGGTPAAEYDLISFANAKLELGIDQLEADVADLQDLDTLPDPVLAGTNVAFHNGTSWTTRRVRDGSNVVDLAGVAADLGVGAVSGLSTTLSGIASGRLLVTTTGGTGNVALPAVSGVNLLDVAVPGAAMFVTGTSGASRYLETATMPFVSNWGALTSSTNILTVHSPSVLYPAASTFAVSWPSGGPTDTQGHLKLTAGVYRVSYHTTLESVDGTSTAGGRLALWVKYFDAGTFANPTTDEIAAFGPTAIAVPASAVPLMVEGLIVVPAGFVARVKVSYRKVGVDVNNGGFIRSFINEAQTSYTIGVMSVQRMTNL